MKPGPRPVPTAIREVRGNPRRHPLPENEPMPTTGIPERPDDLDDVAAAAWDRLAALLDGMHVLTVADGEALAHLCMDISMLEDAAQTLKNLPVPKLGSRLLTKSGNGVVTISPLYRIVHAQRKAIREWLREFGLTPASRTGVKTIDGKSKQDSAWADM